MDKDDMDYLLVLINNIKSRGLNAMSRLRFSILSGDPNIMDTIQKQTTRLKYECPEQSSLLNLAIVKGDLIMLRVLLAAGAKVNASSAVIGSPLHVACSSAKIRNRNEIIEMLLQYGADPNLKVYYDEDGTQLRLALAEYIASHSAPSVEIVKLLLRYGAKVIMKTRIRDPDGMLEHIHNVLSEKNQHIFYLLLDAAESFDLYMWWNNTITATQREALLNRTKTPISLLAQSRVCLRRHYKNKLVDVAETAQMPKILHDYLLFK